MTIFRRSPRRNLAALGSVLMLVLVSTACASGGSGSGSSSSTPIVGGTLRVITPTEPVTLNPIQSVISDARVWGSILDPLIDVDVAGTPQDSGLLTSWKQTSSTEWEFTVRGGVKFSNGEAFDAAAAAFSIKENKTDPKAKLATYMSVVSDVKAGDATKLHVTTTTPYIALPQLLSVVYALPPANYTEQGAAKFAKAPVGTGGFTLASYEPGQKITVKKNPDYWRGPGKLDGIVFSWAPDAASRLSLLQTGAADVAIDVPVEQKSALVNDPQLTLLSEPSTSEMAVFFETAKAPFNDEKLRKAASMAIDRDSIVKSLFHGDGAQAQPFLIGQLMSSEPKHSKPTSYDPAGAKTLLAGSRPTITFSYTVGRYPQDSKVGEAVSGMLEAVGFDVKRNPLDVTKFFELRPKGAFEMYMYQISPVFLQPDVYVHGFLTNNSITKHCVDPKIDALSAQALAAETVQESDKTYADIEDYVLNQKVCNVPLYDVVGLYGLSKKVDGFVAPRNLLPNWAVVSLKN
ncbi:peptide/nickel transport system substrate-binding protein [Arthrobacter ginsengisoli]|uniref:Peptide/nickel transport system substrate-binding protein n=1 Tax=Arthrobacter ginsengisoli TaxID=1356565 RepID=A0ABU1UI41_9MICC|nr:ABC transporter substrate-binding protein [Arthrobacter ginsengisoli]MDR7084838.1 peptide/nickel transport system substrate-binding protein [Arthrobacter ginsengisoli]